MDAAGKYAAKKLLGDHIAKNQKKKVCGNEDPFFELVRGRNGRTKKVKRAIPDYIPAHDAEILAQVRSRAYHLDMSLFNFLGMRFGWSSVIGLIPEIGDVIDVWMAWSLYKKICNVECELDSSIKNRMKFNIALDFVIGLVPFIGDLGDAAFKCNTKNAVLLSQALDKAYARDIRGQKLGDAARKRMSRELFTDDPDYIPGQPPPVYDDPPPDYNNNNKNNNSSNAGIWAWLTGRSRDSGNVDVERGQGRFDNQA